MNLKSMFGCFAASSAALLCSACMPMPFRSYVGDPSQGELVYSSCSLNKNLPTGVLVPRRGVTATLRMSEHGGRDYLEVRFDVPQGKTLTLGEGVVQLDRRDGTPLQEAKFPNVSLSDTPIVTSRSALAAEQHRLLPIGTPLVGQRMVYPNLSFDKHFWVATYIDPAAANDIWITMPAVKVNGEDAGFTDLHFHRQLFVGMVLMNC